MDLVRITYIFTTSDNVRKVFEVRLNATTLELVEEIRFPLPDWVRLDFHQCPVCPLTMAAHPYCPAAAHLVSIVKCFDGLLSHDPIRLDVITEERSISKDTTVQRAVGSMMGLVLAASGCPRTVHFRPMARFHLPLASEEETVYRATSMYLLAQYFRQLDGHDPDLQLTGLMQIYNNIQTVNRTIAERLRAATETDSSINAIIFLDMYAKAMPYVIREALEEVRHLFVPYFQEKNGG